MPEVLNVHVNESKKKNLLFLEIFFFKQGKNNCDFLKCFFKFEFISFNCG